MNISSWLNDAVILKRYKGQSGNGDRVYEPDTTLKCRIEKKTKIVNAVGGNLTVGNGVIYCKDKISNNDRFIYEDKTYEIINLAVLKNKNGIVSYYEGVFV